MDGQLQLTLTDDGGNSGVCLLQDLCIRNFGLPRIVEISKAFKLKIIHLFYVPYVSGPAFTSVEN